MHAAHLMGPGSDAAVDAQRPPASAALAPVYHRLVHVRPLPQAVCRRPPALVPLTNATATRRSVISKAEALPGGIWIGGIWIGGIWDWWDLGLDGIWDSDGSGIGWDLGLGGIWIGEIWDRMGSRLVGSGIGWDLDRTGSGIGWDLGAGISGSIRGCQHRPSLPPSRSSRVIRCSQGGIAEHAVRLADLVEPGGGRLGVAPCVLVWVEGEGEATMSRPDLSCRRIWADLECGIEVVLLGLMQCSLLSRHLPNQARHGSQPNRRQDPTPSPARIPSLGMPGSHP